MRIAVIGTGRMGTGLATSLAKARHQVVFGSRDPSAAADLVERSGASGAVGSGDAVQGAEVVFLAIPWAAVEETLPLLGDLTGRVVVDITNPYVGGRMQPPENSSTTELIQEWTGARVVKGWNHVYAKNLTQPEIEGQASTVFLAGDDAEAKEVVAGLARDIGFDPVDVGGAEGARVLTDLLAVLGGLKLGPDRPLKVLARHAR
jgi:8-hydroxy-5-deazaflavin:NADPH oxidoreductase